MKRFMLWVMVAILICGLNVFTACDDNKDQPINNQERQAFDTALSRAVDEASNNVRLDKGSEVLQ